MKKVIILLTFIFGALIGSCVSSLLEDADAETKTSDSKGIMEEYFGTFTGDVYATHLYPTAQKLAWESMSGGTRTLTENSPSVQIANGSTNSYLYLPAGSLFGNFFYFINNGSAIFQIAANTGHLIINAGQERSVVNLSHYKCASMVCYGNRWFITEGHVF